MDWIIHNIIDNTSVLGAGITMLLSLFGAKKVVGSKLRLIFSVVKEVIDVIFVFTKALKPDHDGVVRIEEKELKSIQKEIGELRKVIGKLMG